MDHIPETFVDALSSGDTEHVNHAIDDVENMELEERAALFDEYFAMCRDLYASDDGYQRQSVIRFAASLYPRLAYRTVGADLTDKALPGEWLLNEIATHCERLRTSIWMSSSTMMAESSGPQPRHSGKWRVHDHSGTIAIENAIRLSLLTVVLVAGLLVHSLLAAQIEVRYMVEISDLPHRPLTEAEVKAFRDEQDVECPVGYFAFCSHCDKSGLTDALVRDGRRVYVLHHGWDDWELNVLEEDFDPDQFQVMAEMMKRQAGFVAIVDE